MKLSKSLKPEPQKNTEESKKEEAAEDFTVPKLSTEEQERLAKEVIVDMQNDCEKACKEELIRMRADIRKEDREKCSAITREMQKNVGGSNLFYSMPLIKPVPPPAVDYLTIPPSAYETVEGMQNACENACKQELIQKRYAIRKEDWEKCNAIIKKMQEKEL